MAAETIRIRRYPNRRFYDRTHRRYVTLQDIEELVCAGRTVAVQDSRTGEDLTRQVLTQILLERHPEKMDLFPVAMLHGLLRANDLVVEFWRGSLRQALAMLEGLQQAGPLDWMKAFFPGLHPAAGPGPAAADLAGRLAALEARLGRLEGAAGAAARAPAGGDPLEDLERRIRGLEQHPPRP